MNKVREYGIHDFFETKWKRKPEEVLKEFKISYETYIFYDHDNKEADAAKGILYAYFTDPLTNVLIFNEIGVTDDCPIAEIEVPR